MNGGEKIKLPINTRKMRISIPLLLLSLAFIFAFSISAVSAASHDAGYINGSSENAAVNSLSEGNGSNVAAADSDKWGVKNTNSNGYYLQTRITGLANTGIFYPKKAEIKVKLETYYEGDWVELPWRYVNFNLYDSNNNQVWNNRALTNLYTYYASVTIDTKSLYPGTYRLKASYDGNFGDGFYPCDATAEVSVLWPNNDSQVGDTRIVDLQDQTVKQGNSVKVKATLESWSTDYDPAGHKIYFWMERPFRYLNFFLYDANGNQVWNNRVLSGMTGTATATINTKKLNLSPGTYRLLVKYNGNSSKYTGLNPCEATAYITVNPNISDGDEEGDTKIDFLDDYSSYLDNYSVNKGDKVKIHAQLLSYDPIEGGYDGKETGWRYLDFYLYRPGGDLLWHGKVLTNLLTQQASVTIDTKKLNLSTGNYVIEVDYGGNKTDKLKPCTEYAVLHVV